MKNVILFLFTLFSLGLFGQTVSVSPPLTMRSDSEYELIGNVKGNTLVYQKQGEKYIIQCFDNKLQQTWDKELELDEKRPKVEGVIPTTKDFSVVYYFKKQGETILKLHRYDAGANLIDLGTTIK